MSVTLKKIKSVNYVEFGESSQKHTPFIKLSCVTEDGTKCSWKGYYTVKSEKILRESLALFGFEGEIAKVQELEDSSARASFFKPPRNEVSVEEKSFVDKMGKQVTWYDVVSLGMTSKFDEQYKKEAWSSFDRNSKLSGKTDEIPF